MVLHRLLVPSYFRGRVSIKEVSQIVKSTLAELTAQNLVVDDSCASPTFKSVFNVQLLMVWDQC